MNILENVYFNKSMKHNIPYEIQFSYNINYYDTACPKIFIPHKCNL